MDKKYLELDEKQLERLIGGSNIFSDIGKGIKDFGDRVYGFIKGVVGF